MKKIELQEIMLPGEYEKIRSEILPQIIALKKRRRVPLGDKMSLVFENHKTLWFQVQEMVRIEHMEKPELIQEELDVYNPLLPERGQLSATLFIELTDPDRFLEELQQFHGIESEQTVYLEFQPGPRIFGEFDILYRNPRKVTTVYFLKFNVPEDLWSAFDNPNTGLHLVVDHPNYYARTQLPLELRKELARELREP